MTEGIYIEIILINTFIRIKKWADYKGLKKSIFNAPASIQNRHCCIWDMLGLVFFSTNSICPESWKSAFELSVDKTDRDLYKRLKKQYLKHGVHQVQFSEFYSALFVL